MWHRFTEPARQAVLLANRLAADRRDATVQSAHLFIALLEIESHRIDSILSLSGVSRTEAKLYAESALETTIESGGSNRSEKPKMDGGAKRALNLAAREATAAGSEYIGADHLFLACIRPQRGSHLGQVLRPLGFDAPQIRRLLSPPAPSRRNRREGNPLNHLSAEANIAIEAAHEIMRTTFCGRISAVHLLLGLLAAESNSAIALLRDAGIDEETLRSQARAEITSDGQIAVPQKKFSSAAKRALERAKRESNQVGDVRIGPDHILIGLLPHSEKLRLSFGPRSEDYIDRVFTPAQSKELRQVYELRQDSQWDEPGSVPDNAADPLAHLSAKSKDILAAARAFISEGSAERVSTLHLFLGLLQDNESNVRPILQSARIDHLAFESAARALLESPDFVPETGSKSNATWRALKRAHAEARHVGYRFIGPEHLLLGLIPRPSSPEETEAFGELTDPLEPLWSPDMILALRAAVHAFIPQQAAILTRLPQRPTEPGFLENFGLFLKTFLLGALGTLSLETLLSLRHMSAWGPTPAQLLFGPLLALGLAGWLSQNWETFSQTRTPRASLIGAMLAGALTAFLMWHPG